MVQSISAFIEACYIVHRNPISAPMLECFKEWVAKFHELRNIFIAEGVRVSISLPWQHALSHYYKAVQLFGSPNGLCSSITESKHIVAVKEPWRRSSRYKALSQMLRILVRMNKMDALCRIFTRMGMMVGTTSSYIAGGAEVSDKQEQVSGDTQDDIEENLNNDVGPAPGAPSDPSLFDVKLASRIREYHTH
jgi:hypothetical protein